MHMDEENAAKIAEREVEASMCETKKEQINAQGLHCNVDDTDDSESHYDGTHVDDDCKVICELVNPVTTDGFGEVEIVNEHMHGQISHRSVDEHYVDDMCGFFFEIEIDCGNMVNTMLDETLKVEVTTIAARHEAVGTIHEGVCHLAVVDDQEEDKVIEDFLMRISTNNITVEDNLHEVEKKVDVEQEALTKEHNINVFNIVFEYVDVQNSTWEKKLKARLLINLM